MTATAETMTSEALLISEAQEALEMALAAGADNAVARVGEGRGTSYSYRDGSLEKVEHSGTRALSIALYVDGRYSAHESNDLRPETLRTFLAEAVELTRALEPDPHRQLPDPALYEGRAEIDLDLVDPAVRSLTRDACVGWLSTMDDAVHADDRVISATSHLSLREGAMGRVTSNGFAGARRTTGATTYTEVTVQDEGDKRPEAYALASARHLGDLPEPGTVASKALARALARMGTAKGKSQRTTLVVDPEAVGGLLGRMFGALTGNAIQQGRSFLKDRLNQQVASKLLSITDNPLRVRGLASGTFDVQGLATQVRPVIADGVLSTFFIDTYYASKLGCDPTTGGPSNLEMKLGDKDLAGLIAAAGSGVYVTSWNGGNADVTNGDFSFGLQGHVIENGKIGAPIGEMNVTGNYTELLASLVAVGNDPFPYSSFLTPTLVFENAQLSGA